MRWRVRNGFLLYVSKQNGVKMTAAEIILKKKSFYSKRTIFWWHSKVLNNSLPFELKVNKFQNEFMKSSFLPKYEQKIVRTSALTSQGRNPDNFCYYFGRNDEFINSFWKLLTFTLCLGLEETFYWKRWKMYCSVIL